MKQLYYIRGVNGRGGEVISKLKEYYPDAICDFAEVTSEDQYYYISIVENKLKILHTSLESYSSFILRTYGMELHLNPKFKPFEKILNGSSGVWTADFFSNYIKDENLYMTANGSYLTENEILPYKGNENKLGKLVCN